MDFREELHDRVYCAFQKNYSSNDSVKERLEMEMDYFDKFRFHEYFLLMQVLTAKCRSQGCRYSTSLDGSFAAYLLGMTRYNPLPMGESPIGGHESTGFDLSLNFDARPSLWIRVNDEIADTLIKTLWRVAQNDIIDSEYLQGLRYILHPALDGGQTIDILSVPNYLLLDKTKTILGHADISGDSPLWDSDIHKCQIPGFFSDTEYYELKNSQISTLEGIAHYIRTVRGISKARAWYLAVDYLEAAYYVHMKPAIWFSLFLNDNVSLFNYEKMGMGKEKCRREKLRNWERTAFTDLYTSSKAKQLNPIYSACEAAYNCGLIFLSPDPLLSERGEFIITDTGALLSPLPVKCTLKSE